MRRAVDLLLSPERWAYAFIAAAVAGGGLAALGYRRLGLWLCAPLAAYLAFGVIVVVPLLLFFNGRQKRRKRAPSGESPD